VSASVVPTVLQVEPLTAVAFAPFGDVIAPASAKRVYAVNEGTAQRFHDLAEVDTASDGGRTLVSIFRAQPRSLPFHIHMLERHPLGSQAFIPLLGHPYLIAVSESPQHRPRVFLAEHGEGVNYRPGTWHHPLIALNATSDFLVVDRGGGGHNCDEAELPVGYVIEAM
jgi:ureidoglycolate lyase